MNLFSSIKHAAAAASGRKPVVRYGASLRMAYLVMAAFIVSVSAAEAASTTRALINSESGGVPFHIAALKSDATSTGSISITQSNDTSTIDPTSAVCGAENYFLRRFFLNVDHGISTPYTVSNVQFAAEESYAQAPVDVQLYSIAHGAALIFANMTLIGSTTVIIPSTFDLNGYTNPAPESANVTATIVDPVGSDLVVALHFSYGSGSAFYPGLNNGGQTEPSYYACGQSEPTNTSGFGFPDNIYQLLMVVNAPPPCTPAPANLVSSYKAEGNANDAQNLNNGILVGSPTFVAGEIGQAFSGFTTNDYVKIPASPSLDLGALGTGLSVDAWINPADFNGYHAIAEWNNGSQYGVHFYTSNDGTGSLYANIIDTAGQSHPLYSSAALVIGTFQHVALTYDKASGLTTLYANGAQVAQQNMGSFTPQTSYDLYLGHHTGSDGAYPFTGSIDELHLYSRALSAAEISGIFTAAAGGECAVVAPTGLHDFTAVTGVARNSSQTSNSQTIAGITGNASVAISGDSSAQYSVNSDALTNVPGTVKNGDIVAINLTASANPGTATGATLTVGTVLANYAITTVDSTTPNAFSFTAQTGAALSTPIASNAIAVGGISKPSAISITGGSYKVNSGAYTALPGTVNGGDQVTLQLTSSPKYNAAVKSTLTIGGVSAVFSVTTLALPSPTGLTATAGAGGTVNLSWTASSGAASYSLFQGTSAAGVSATAVQSGIAGTTATVSGLALGNTYYFQVGAVSGTNFSVKSSEAKVELPLVPSVAISLHPTAMLSGSSTVLSWSSTSATTCTASGTPSATTWSGNRAVNGSNLTITKTGVGTFTYILTCSNISGTTSQSAKLIVAKSFPLTVPK